MLILNARWLAHMAALWASLMWLTGCSNNIINKPIALHKAGSVVEAKFEIPEKDGIYLRLEFLVNDQPGDRERLLTFLEGKNKRDLTGTPTPVKVKITNYATTKNEVFIEKTYLASGVSGIGSDFFYRRLVDLAIPQGKYIVRLETLEDFPQLSNTPVNFLLGYNLPPKY